MKTTISILFVIAVLFVGCNKTEVTDFIDEQENEEVEPEQLKELTDGFCLTLRDTVVLNHDDFEYYDYSAHLVYMKDHMSFVKDIQGKGGNFKVYANKEVIYSGQTYPAFLSSYPLFPVIIHTWPSLYADNIIFFEYYDAYPLTDSLGNVLPDPRNDERIVNALKKYNQFHAGLSGEIKSVQYFSANNVKVELLLKNNDSFNYYYLDPDKTGIGLFHYFTNGLFIRELNNYKTYTHKIETISADPWDTWKKVWLSVINGNESKEITIIYDNFDDVPKGQYKATFRFPGLSFQVDKKDIIQDNGQIWLGKLNLAKEITIE